MTIEDCQNLRIEDGWHLVCDPTGARAAMDPWGAEYWFVRFKGGKVVEQTKREHGFNRDVAQRLKARLEAQLKALDRPVLFYEHLEEHRYYRQGDEDV